MSAIESIISENPSFKLLSKSKLYKVLKVRDKSITMKQVETYLETKQLPQVFRKPNKPIPFKITAESIQQRGEET